MDKATFVRKVQDAIEKEMHIDRVRTEKMIGGVFSALSARLTPSEGEELIAQLPESLKGLWRHEVATRLGWGEKEVIKLSRDHFLQRSKPRGIWHQWWMRSLLRDASSMSSRRRSAPEKWKTRSLSFPPI